MYVFADYEIYFPASLMQTYSVRVRFESTPAGSWSFERNYTAAVRGGAAHEAVGALAFFEDVLPMDAGDAVLMTLLESRWSHSPGPGRNVENWNEVGARVDGLTLCKGG